MGVPKLAMLFLLMLPILDLRAAEPATSGGVTVYRGPGSGPLPAPPAPAGAERRMLAGRTVWTVDEASGTVAGCRLERTMMVGQRRVRCGRGRMPEP